MGGSRASHQDRDYAMIANDSAPDRCYGGVAQSANEFVEAVTASLEACEEIPDEEVAEIKEAGEAFSRDVQAFEEEKDGEIEDLRRENHQLRKELSEYRSENERDKASMKGRISSVEGGSGDATPTPEGEETTIRRPNCPLERIVSLPEHLSEQELTSNQSRARFLAMDVLDYSQKVPAGRSIDSPTVKKILKARDGKTPHSQTVARVMDFLDRFGQDGTRLVKRRGTKRIVFTEQAVDRLSNLSNDQGEITPEVRQRA